MGEKFEDKKNELEKEEMNKQHAYDMMVQDLTDQVESATTQREKKAARMAATKEQSGRDQGEQRHPGRNPTLGSCSKEDRHGTAPQQRGEPTAAPGRRLPEAQRA